MHTLFVAFAALLLLLLLLLLSKADFDDHLAWFVSVSLPSPMAPKPPPRPPPLQLRKNKKPKLSGPAVEKVCLSVSVIITDTTGLNSEDRCSFLSSSVLRPLQIHRIIGHK
ncbi:hypothetical protein BO70DRAFT_356403 [Aspergillus heteromorphus CBS 117.55]|uniref:Secreted protein n=1 Tax=Aspergillus heteromorphus CBS 117.55 TaxID=1448321 RepID=A0A317V4T0_9EURO|nr:uncharacterized protein BO70DRAFT_356403 [Aspergillus heteromorphus CBS 117.55]PWY67200.1 hypothetical protein BO70DRAFT_356403 [Aspergillus heteromorphus CBS 117.55]